MAEIIIADEELRTCAENTGKYSEGAENMLEELTVALDNISANKFKEGNTAENFKILTEQVQKLQGGFAEIMEEEKKAIEDFIQQIGEAEIFIHMCL